MPKTENFGKYRIERVLGRGGMGTVYEAVDSVINRKVALKTMMQHLAGNTELRARFLREAQAAGGLKHRNIVTVYDLGEDHGMPFIAMEFIEGTDLERIIQNREPVTVEWKIEVLRQICEGLSAAHRAGVIHRDVKPANIRVTPEREVKIMDFGIAHLQAANTMTAGGLVMGTLQYMAPEIVDNRKPDRRADVFSVGAIAYELMANRKPFEADSLSALMFKITHERADPRLLPKTKYSPSFERIIMKALHRDLDERYQSLGDMRSDLTAILADKSSQIVARADPAGAKTLVEKGRKLLSAGDVAGALECAKDALALYPEDGPAAGLARAAAPIDLPEKNVPETTNVVDDLAAELARARSEGQLQKALSICRRILDLTPNDDAVRIAADEIDREIKGKEVEQLLAAAVSYAREGDFDLSAKIATKVGKIDPENAKLKDLLQFLREETGRRDSEALVATAKEHLALGNLEEAIAAAEEALHFSPTLAVAREIRDGAGKLLASRQPPPPRPPAPAPVPPPPPPPAPALRQQSVEELVSDPEPESEPMPLPPPPVVRPAPAAPPPMPRSQPPAARPPAPAAAAPPPPVPPRPATPTPAEARPAKVAATSLATPPPVTGGGGPAEVAALLESALNHFLMSENKKAKKAVEKVLALDPGNRKAQELIKMLGTL